MERKVLFSVITELNKDALLQAIFPDELSEKVAAYMPSDGAHIPEKYVNEWKGYAESHDASFVVINNSVSDESEKQKLLSSNILIISGGNTFTLLNHLRTNGLDNAIQKFAQKENYVIAGFSAGAIVLTPTISVAAIPGYDENMVGITDLAGLSLVDFELFAHYSSEWKEKVDEYEAKASYPIKRISDDEFIVLDK